MEREGRGPQEWSRGRWGTRKAGGRGGGEAGGGRVNREEESAVGRVLFPCEPSGPRLGLPYQRVPGPWNENQTDISWADDFPHPGINPGLLQADFLLSEPLGKPQTAFRIPLRHFSIEVGEGQRYI